MKWLLILIKGIEEMIYFCLELIVALGVGSWLRRPFKGVVSLYQGTCIDRSAIMVGNDSIFWSSAPDTVSARQLYRTCCIPESVAVGRQDSTPSPHPLGHDRGPLCFCRLLAPSVFLGDGVLCGRSDIACEDISKSEGVFIDCWCIHWRQTDKDR